ncbi:DsbA family oxidoreductase [Occultella kanbiaonis]|uniref:DsbA family oxidoreductase n=1 Tax=Occultella kanbiaonis TaxID=2675754 RepID=UPI0012B764D5|nr:DsbA family oxidoreductase [Occultella kanbiaonis]
MSDTIKVDIWSDIACPFCYIGKRKFEAGVAASGVPVEVVYHSYELAPDTPEDVTESHAQLLAKKMRVSVPQARLMEQQLTDTARSAGLEFDYEQLKPARTLKAHQVLHYAKMHGKQVEMKERLMRAYFTDGRDIGKLDELAELAAEIGLDRDDLVRVLETGRYLEEVQADIRQAQAYGIRGVPFFVIDGKYGVSGAQEPAAFAQALTQARDEKAVAS